MFEVKVEVVTPEYKYSKLFRGFETITEAKNWIERQISEWPEWTEWRKAAFRSRCKIMEQ